RVEQMEGAEQVDGEGTPGLLPGFSLRADAGEVEDLIRSSRLHRGSQAGAVLQRRRQEPHGWRKPLRRMAGTVGAGHLGAALSQQARQVSGDESPDARDQGPPVK